MLNTPVQPSTTVQSDSDDDAILREHRQKRLKNIIISRLKDTRDVLETREALARSWKTGGMEFAPEQVERVGKEIELAKQALIEELKTLRVEQPYAQQSRQEESFGSVFEEHMKELSELELEAAPKEDLLEKQASSVQRPASSVNPIDNDVPQELRVTRRPHLSLNPEPSTLNAQDAKPNVDSVKNVFQSSITRPRVLGPIDELANMTLEDFRRLGTPAEASRKIVEKVDLLAVDSLLEQKKGIDAWKRSEAYQLYLSIGIESLEKKVAVIEIIENRRKEGKSTLSQDEFNILADVNRKISFSR